MPENERNTSRYGFVVGQRMRVVSDNGASAWGRVTAAGEETVVLSFAEGDKAMQAAKYQKAPIPKFQCVLGDVTNTTTETVCLLEFELNEHRHGPLLRIEQTEYGDLLVWADAVKLAAIRPGRWWGE